MKYDRTPRFKADWKALPEEHRRLFRRVVPEFAAACEAYADSGGAYTWPQKLRVTPMVNVAGVWEMTWSFASPDGRATFSFERVDGELRVLWRRIGTHAIYKNP